MLVGHRLKVTLTGDIRGYSSLPRKARDAARDAGVDVKKDVFYFFRAPKGHDRLGFPKISSDAILYGGDPRGSFPGKYLIVVAGWGHATVSHFDPTFYFLFSVFVFVLKSLEIFCSLLCYVAKIASYFYYLFLYYRIITTTTTRRHIYTPSCAVLVFMYSRISTAEIFA